MNRTDGGRPTPGRRCETMPTPGAAPRGAMAREPQEACRGSDARAAPDARRGHPEPPRRVRPRARGRARTPSALTLSPSGPGAIDGHVRLLLAWTEAINLTGDPRAGRGRDGHVVDSLQRASRLRERGIDRFVDLGSGGGFPGLPDRRGAAGRPALLLDPSAKKARFLTAAVERRPGWRGPSRRSPVRAEALAADRRHRGRWPAVTSRAVAGLAELVELASRCSTRAARSSPGSAATLDAELTAAARASTRSAAASLESVRRGGRRARRPSAGDRHVARPVHARRLPARPRRAQAAPVVSGPAATLRPRCGSPSSRTSTATSSPSMPSSPRSVRSTPSGISATSSATGPSQTASSAA